MASQETYLERIDRARNMARYYRLSIAVTLFGEWAVVREWGRIGQSGQSSEQICSSRNEAAARLAELTAFRIRRGYRAA